MTNTHLRFDDEYQPSDSDDDLSEHEKVLLKKVRIRKEKYSDSEEEVFGLDSDDGAQSDIALSDVEGQEEDDLPNVRAWGKDKRKFYSTDYIDPDYGGYQGKDAVLADIEEQEARNLQKQLAQQLDDEDFTLDVFNKAKVIEDKIEAVEVVKTDISTLSRRQKLQLLQKESPEFFGLIEDFKQKMSILQEYLRPVINLNKSGKISNCDALDCVKSHYSLILNYCTNICMYLLLKASRVNTQNHPIAKRLYQYRSLLSQMESVFDEIIKPQIEVIIKQHNNEGELESVEQSRKKTLKLLLKLSENKKNIDEPPPKMRFENDSKPESIKQRKEKSVTFNETNLVNGGDSSDEEQPKDVAEQTDNQNSESKRAITYQMAKNKGLTPYRKKELRNPRVKHRNKFRKAKIRRKGAIRDVRTEMTRYAGESSGIKAAVTKSIKIKS